MDAWLGLEDGTVYEGRAAGNSAWVTGELVFTTAMTGYQEVLTDPSFKGQIVVMTNPHIGNYGIRPDASESDRPWVEGLVVHELSRTVGEFEASSNLPDYLARGSIPCLMGIDTRSLVRRIRDKGVMRAVLTTLETKDPHGLPEIARRSTPMIGRDLVSCVTTDRSWWAVPKHGDERVWSRQELAADCKHLAFPELPALAPIPDRFLVVYDFGVKHGILRSLLRRGYRCLVVPAKTPADDVLELGAAGVVLSNGPGDPAALDGIFQEVKTLIGRIPILGICLGHQLLGLALGGRTYKLPFGHRGINHPVVSTSNRVYITTQNHGFALHPNSLPNTVIPTFVHKNDGTLEGFQHRRMPIFAVQFHPEAAPGPHEAAVVFDDFLAEL